MNHMKRQGIDHHKGWWIWTKNSKKKKQKLYKTRQAREKHWQKLTAKMEKKKFDHYKKELDTVHSRYVRSQWSCVTCWAKENIQNWHFISRRHYKYRRDDDNTFPQCVRCNVILNWNYIEYMKYMINKYWYDFVNKRTEEIKSSYYRNKKPSIEWMKQKIEYYKKITTN